MKYSYTIIPNLIKNTKRISYMTNSYNKSYTKTPNKFLICLIFLASL